MTLHSWMDYMHHCPDCGADEEESDWDTDGFRQCQACGGEWNVVEEESFGELRQKEEKADV